MSTFDDHPRTKQVRFAVGDPWPSEVVRIPDGDLSMGLHAQRGNPPLLLIGDPSGEITSPWPGGVAHVAFQQHGPLLVALLRADWLPPDVVHLEGVSAWIDGYSPLSISADGQHLLLRVVVVSAGRVARLNLSTVSPRMTKFLRRISAEERAAGPLSQAEFLGAVASWRATTPEWDSAWRRTEVECRLGD